MDSKEKKRIRDRERYQRNREKILEQKREYHLTNKEKISAKKRDKHERDRDTLNKKSAEWRKNNPEKAASYGKEWREKNPERAIIGRIASAYNVCLESASDWYKLTMTSCDSCGDVWLPTHSKRLFIDHDHTTGLIRGVLCHHCNSALGLLKEDDVRILALLAYNRKHNG